MHSIRRQLLIVLAAGFTALIGGAGLYVAGTLETRITEEFDATLTAKARALAQLTEQESGQIEFDYIPEHMPDYERAQAPMYFEIWLDSGISLYRSPRLQTPLLARPLATPGPAPQDLRLPDGRAGRVVALRFVPPPPEEADAPGEGDEAVASGPPRGLILAVAEGRERLDGLVRRARWAIFGTGGVAVLLAVLLVWRALAAGLRPLREIAEQVQGLDAERLDARVALHRTPRELSVIVVQLNALLARLHASFERERRFTANVTHELRTPLAELRSLAEVGAAWPEDHDSVRAFFADVQAVANRMQGVIKGLLLLARCQAGVENLSLEPTRLQDSLEDARSRTAPAFVSRGLGFHFDVPAHIVLDTDPGKLAILLQNVLGNAMQYAPPHSEIRCVASSRGNTFELEIANAAPMLTAEELALLDQPFWRKDASGSSEEHAGLGLALVTALAPLLDLEVGFRQDADGRFRVRISGNFHNPKPILSSASG